MNKKRSRTRTKANDAENTIPLLSACIQSVFINAEKNYVLKAMAIHAVSHAASRRKCQQSKRTCIQKKQFKRIYKVHLIKEIYGINRVAENTFESKIKISDKNTDMILRKEW